MLNVSIENCMNASLVSKVLTMFYFVVVFFLRTFVLTFAVRESIKSIVTPITIRPTVVLKALAPSITIITTSSGKPSVTCTTYRVEQNSIINSVYILIYTQVSTCMYILFGFNRLIFCNLDLQYM